jgi:nitrate/nitrite-specific signal transduction histidine kinase/CheY-like chemotaxis protein
MDRALRLLLIEDSEDDAEFVLRSLRFGGYEPVAERVSSAEEVNAALERGGWDLVISDYVMPGFGGLEALELCKKKGLDVPFIIVSGHIGEEVAVASLKAGANDYVMKDRLARLAPAVQRALQETRIARAHKLANEALRENEARLRKTVEELRISEEALRKSNDELSIARSDLEKRVEERTADLVAANRELQSQMKERKRLESELLEIAENERRRIGFDLHDDIGQKLMGVSLLLKALETNLSHKQMPESAQVLRVQELVGHIVNHTHDLAHCFSSMDAEGEDLRELLTKLIANIKKTFHIATDLEAPEKMPELQSNSVLQLYKIAQEALSNAIKHGKASKISITLAQNDGRLTLKIENDGVPFPTTYKPTNRMGLRIMNYRAHTIGGTLEIAPAQNSGTVVTCVVPCINGHRNARPTGKMGSRGKPAVA